MNNPYHVIRGVTSGSVQGIKPDESRLFILSRLLLALMFSGATLLYNTYWMIANQPPSTDAVELGFYANYLPEEHAVLVTAVQSNSPAENAGLRAGDRITEIYGTQIKDQSFQTNEWMKHKPGDIVDLTIVRSGQAEPLPLRGRFRQVQPSGGYLQSLAARITNSFQFPFVVVGLSMLFLRIQDPKAWLLALLFGSCTTVASFPDYFAAVPQSLRLITSSFQALLLGCLGPLFYWFFAVFPAKSPIERRLPWLKWSALAIGISIALPGLRDGVLHVPPPFREALGIRVSEAFPVWFTLGFMALGLVSLAANFTQTGDSSQKRKIRVMFWGTVIGFGSNLIEHSIYTLLAFSSRPWWLNTIKLLLICLFPLSIAYAVVRHQVLEIPILLKRSARYFLVQRGFTLLLSLLSIGVTLLFAFSLAGFYSRDSGSPQSSGIALGAVFGTGLLLTGMQVHRRISSRIDRAFFRAAYDIRILLEDLAERMGTVSDRRELAQLLSRKLKDALQPSLLTVYLEEPDHRLQATMEETPEDARMVAADSPVLNELARRAKPWNVSADDAKQALAGSNLTMLNPEWLVPILGRDGHMLGLIVLGTRLSEEPYSGEDSRLLASVAGQAGTALQNIRMAEEIAQNLENERRTAREMEIAKEVQSRLLPQMPPKLETLECSAQCIQARAVGGDYYDFLDLGSGQTGLVLADVSGKGVHAALLMANLQAQLRSQSSIAGLEIDKMLSEVNRTLWKSTAAQHFATLFFGGYQDSTRRLTYVNCGHNPPVWLHSDGTAERLPTTATVLGMFGEWECSIDRIELVPGDLLAIFSDGVTEATNGNEEYGETRLIEVLRDQARKPAEHIVTAVLASVQKFSVGIQSDDLTLLVGRCITRGT